MNQSKPLFEELSDLELEAVAGGGNNEGLVVLDVSNVNIGVNAAVLNTKPSQGINFPMTQQEA